MRKKLVAILALCVAVPAVALVPAAIYGGLYLTGSGTVGAASGGVAVASGGAGLMSLLGAAALMALMPGNAGDPMVRAPLTAMPASRPQEPQNLPQTVPSGSVFTWTSTAACAPGTATGFTTATDAAASYASHVNGFSCATGNGAYVYSGCSGWQIKYVNNGQTSSCYQPVGNITLTAQNTCSSGYSWNGTACVLTNPRGVPDNKCDFGMENGAYVSIGDPDCGGAGQVGVIRPDGSLEFSGRDAQGNPILLVLTPTAGGGARIQYMQQRADPSGNTAVQQQELQVSPQGQVQGVGQATTPGSLQPNQAGDALQPSLQPQAQPLYLEFPTDYARINEAEQAQVATRQKLDKIHDALTASGPAASDPVADMSQWNDIWFKDTFTKFYTFTPPEHQSECPALAYDFTVFSTRFQHSVTDHCDLIESQRPTIFTVMSVVWAMAGVFIVMRA